MTSPNTLENDLAESIEPEIDTAGKPQLIYCLACVTQTIRMYVLKLLPEMARRGK